MSEIENIFTEGMQLSLNELIKKIKDIKMDLDGYSLLVESSEYIEIIQENKFFIDEEEYIIIKLKDTKDKLKDTKDNIQNDEIVIEHVVENVFEQLNLKKADVCIFNDDDYDECYNL